MMPMRVPETTPMVPYDPDEFIESVTVGVSEYEAYEKLGSELAVNALEQAGYTHATLVYVERVTVQPLSGATRFEYTFGVPRRFPLPDTDPMTPMPEEPFTVEYTKYTEVQASGARIGLATCKVCGATITLDHRDETPADEIHTEWHRTHPETR